MEAAASSEAGVMYLSVTARPHTVEMSTVKKFGRSRMIDVACGLNKFGFSAIWRYL